MDLRRKAELVPFHFGRYLEFPLRWVGASHGWITWREVFLDNLYHWRVDRGMSSLAERTKAMALRQPDVVVSGDCMAAIGAHREGMDLVWLDAHGDYHTMETTYTGATGGMPLAMLCGRGDTSLLRARGLTPLLPQQVAHLGGTRFDVGERKRMVEDGIRVARDDHRITDGMAEYHLHIDTDLISSIELPWAFHPSTSGLCLPEFWELFDALAPRARVLSVKTGDPHSSKDRDRQGLELVRQLLRRYHVLRTNCG